MIKVVNLGYKYRLYSTEKQKNILDHQMFVYNQTYNICNNLWLKENEKNKKLNKEDRDYRKAVNYDSVVKRALSLRKIKFKTVVTQQGRINFFKAVKKTFSCDTALDRKKAILNAITPKEKGRAFKFGFPKFKLSKDLNQSFTWNNQGYSFKKHKNSKFKIIRIMSMDLKFRSHRDFPISVSSNLKLCSIVISKDGVGYYISFNVEFSKDVGLKTIKENLDISKSIGIDLNTENFAISAYEKPIDNGSRNRKGLKYSKYIKSLERKQSRRVLKTKSNKIKLGRNYKKIQKKLNKLNKKLSNQKNDLYHKISTTLTEKFELIAVEDLRLKNQMTKSAKGNEINPGKNVQQKSGLNRSILSASFYQFVSMIQYKQTMLNDKLFVKVDPKFTSQKCNKCGYVDKDNRKSQSKFKCISCANIDNADMNASYNILDKALKSLGLGISHQTINESLSSSGALAHG